jgi:hypothetical protein
MCSNKTFKKGMTAVDAINVGISARGLSSYNLPQRLATSINFDDASKKEHVTDHATAAGP